MRRTTTIWPSSERSANLSPLTNEKDVESRMRGNVHVRFGGRGQGNPRAKARRASCPPPNSPSSDASNVRPGSRRTSQGLSVSDQLLDRLGILVPELGAEAVEAGFGVSAGLRLIDVMQRCLGRLVEPFTGERRECGRSCAPKCRYRH